MLLVVFSKCPNSIFSKISVSAACASSHSRGETISPKKGGSSEPPQEKAIAYTVPYYRVLATVYIIDCYGIPCSKRLLDYTVPYYRKWSMITVPRTRSFLPYNRWFGNAPNHAYNS